jgi:Protein of unknown function with HXXEE motif
MNGTLSRPAPPSLIWFVPAAILLHHIEEGLALRRYTLRVLALLPEAVRAWTPRAGYVYGALVVATAIPTLLALLAHGRAGRSWATYGVLLVAAVMLVNVLWHLAAAVLLRGYAPGVVTAVAINMPVMSTVLRWARREGWLSAGGLWVYVAIGVMLHGSGLLALFAVARFAT